MIMLPGVAEVIGSGGDWLGRGGDWRKRRADHVRPAGPH